MSYYVIAYVMSCFNAKASWLREVEGGGRAERSGTARAEFPLRGDAAGPGAGPSELRRGAQRALKERGRRGNEGELAEGHPPGAFKTNERR